MKILKKLSGNINSKLISMFIVVSMMPIIIIGIIMNSSSVDEAKDKAFDKLIAIGELKKDQVRDYLEERYDNLDFLSKEKVVLESMKVLTKKFSESGMALNRFVNSNEYSNITGQVNMYLMDYGNRYGFGDILLIDTSGNIVYSIEHYPDFTTNIFTGQYKNSKLREAVKSAKNNEGAAISDFELYPPAKNLPVSFFVNVLWGNSGNILGFIAMQLPIGEINNLMHRSYGLGQTGESYLVGIDRTLRSDTRGSNKTSVLRKEILSESVEAGLIGEKGVHVIDGIRDTKVLSYYSPLGLSKIFNCGFDWVIIVELNKDEAFAASNALFKYFSILGIVLTIVVFLLAFLISRSISLPIKKITKSANLISMGDFNQDIDIDRNDEIGRLANSLRDLQNNMRQKTIHAKKIAKDDYSLMIEPKSDKDELSIALNDMTKALSSISKENKKSIWVTGSQNKLNEKMRGELTLETLSKNIITHLSEHINAQIGALYLSNDSGKELHLVSSYAFSKRKNNNGTIKVGEGLVGQAALERKMISFTDIPDDYIHINSGLGNRKPTNIVVVPIVLEEKLIGVVELGSFREFTDDEMGLLNIVSENIAIGINSAKNRLATEELLETTKQQSVEMAMQQEEMEKANVELEQQTKALKESEASLQAQQEELRQTNEELEEQTKALKDSEDNLQEQQEELRVTNEELAERTKALEKQRDNITIKNDELKKAQDDIRKKANDLEMASKYKSEFLANMSHELRTPLNSILVLSQMLSSNKANNLTEKQIEFASTINSSGKDLLELINDVLDLSKVESGMMELTIDDIDMVELTDEINKKFAHMASDKGLGFKVNLDEKLPRSFHSDSMRLMQIIKNFVSNAIKYTRDGSVTINISRPDSSINLSNSGITPDDAIIISVIDTGIGITKEKQELIFEAFKQADGTTSRKYGGTGLGLSISKNLAQLLGGEIQLNSDQGQGSTFSLIIPNIGVGKNKPKEGSTFMAGKTDVKETPEVTKKPDSESKAKKIKKINTDLLPGADEKIRDDRKTINKGDKIILIIEDDPNFAQILYDLSHDKDYKCLLAQNGETGLHYADFYKPDAIALDIGLPGIDGWEVMERLKDNPDTRHIPVHFMSASDQNMEAMKMGAIGYLSKPASLESINTAFNNIETTISKSVRNLLIVEDDNVMRSSITELIDEDNINIKGVESGKEGLDQLKSGNFDCMILDLGLKDISGFDLLEKIRMDKAIPRIPIIIYTGRELNREEEAKLQKYANSIIIKGAHSPERLISETTLFLHQVESNLPKDKQKMLKMMHDKESSLSGKKILIVDDDMRNVFALSSVLEEANLKVIVGQNGKEGVEQLNKYPDIDLVLMDIMMPEMNGYEAMQEIRKQTKFKKLPIIALTAKAMKGDREKCIQSGANDYLTKPVDTEKLMSLLRVWMYN